MTRATHTPLRHYNAVVFTTYPTEETAAYTPWSPGFVLQSGVFTGLTFTLILFQFNVQIKKWKTKSHFIDVLTSSWIYSVCFSTFSTKNNIIFLLENPYIVLRTCKINRNLGMMSIWWSEFQAARKSWRCWLVDTPTPPAIISPSSGPDKDLDITDGVESWECSVFTVWPVVLAELSWAAEQDKNNPPVPVSVYQYPSMSRAL